MRARRIILISACLLLATGAGLLWLQVQHPSINTRTKPSALPKTAGPTVAQALPFTILSTNNVQAAKTAAAKANQFRYRLSNTTRTIGELVNDRHAILLANALIDTGAKLDLSIPENLQAQGEPGAYIVQANGPIDNAFRATLAAAGAQIVSYIPNNAYLVTIPAGGASALAGNPMTQAVIPYEPYYKLTPSLLAAVANNQPVGELKVAAFPGTDDATKTALAKIGVTVAEEETTPLGPFYLLKNVSDVTAVARIPTLHIVEPSYKRAPANDLSRATVGVAVDSQVSSNYLNLSGSNVLVEVNDSGIDATHPDLTGRIIPDSALSLVDTNGHGTHVAGIIAGDGTKSMTVSNAQGSIMPATNGQFRGMAPLATLYSVAAIDSTSPVLNFGDRYLQEAPARTNALISNNSWNYGDSSYDLAAASYDAAVRDALPEVTGSQPVLFVFSAGNDGGGGDDGSGGNADTILSPATAKNVITVGALEQARGITNVVTAHGTSNEVWQPMTDSSTEVAGYSARGNVGVGIEGGNGRFKPDVVAPGSFVISTRSSQWGEEAYYNPTNYNVTELADLVDPGSENFYSLLVPSNVVQIIIEVFPNIVSTSSVPDLSILLWKGTDPRVSPPDLIKTNMISIPPDSTLAPVGAGWTYAVSNSTSDTIIYGLLVETITTNDNGNYFEVLSNLNNSLGGSPDSTVPPHWYRYESGTSMAAADVSGVLALMQDYFTNILQTVPSPALLKALLINGARPDGNYTYELQNARNFQGWGLISLPNSLPAGMTNVNNTTGESMLILDQSPTNALATGDSHTYSVKFPDGSDGQFFPLQVTLAWTDPPGDPAAAIKLVNSLELVVTNLDTGDVFIGNDIKSGNTFSLPWDTNTPPNIDTINNVQNVFISNPLGTNYSITVIGRSVNVNAVTAQTNNVVQDYALVISCGEGEVTNAFTVTDNGIVSSPTTDQRVSYIGGITAPLLSQFVGASSPLLGTNTVPIGTITVLDTNGVATNAFPAFATNAVVTVGMTNQWHFYVVTNNGSASDFTNAAFITFLPDTLSVPRMGMFADATGNATRPEADIEIYVASGPNASGLTNLDPNVISSCVHGTQVGLSTPAGLAGIFNGAAIGRGGTEFVADIRSTPGQIYYVGVKSEDQMASEYDFMSIFTSTPFSQMKNGNQLVNGQLVPVATIDGSPARPGVAYIFALAIYPMQVGQVTINSLQLWHQNFGDLIGTLNHNGVNDVLNNHDSLGNTFNSLPRVYDDSGSGNNPGSLSSDGPGSLRSFTGNQGIGPWILTEVDNSLTQTGSVQNFQLTVQPHKDLGNGITVTIQPGTWFYDFIDVPVGFTNLTVFATNLATVSVPPLQLFVKLGSEPTHADTNNEVLLNNPGPLGPGNSISIGPPLTPGRYFVGIFNPDIIAHDVYLIAKLSSSASAIDTVDFRSGGPAPIFDDAVTTYSIFVTNTDLIQKFNVGLRVDHPRISDLVFHLISPDGTRYLLMENRGGTTTNGCGATIVNSIFGPASSAGGRNAFTNTFNTGQTFGSLIINYNFFGVPDQMTIYNSINPADFIINGPASILNTGFIHGSGQFSIPYNSSSGYLTNYLYLAFTDDTNLTTTPIKFAPPPFVPTIFGTNLNFGGWESSAPIDYLAPFPMIGSSWIVAASQVSVVNDPPNARSGNRFLALALGTITNTLTTTPGVTYTLTYDYRGPGIVGWWRGENSTTNELAGFNDGIAGPSPGYAPAEVDTGFVINSTNAYVKISNSPSLNVGIGPGFTLEAWINPHDVLTNTHPIFEWNNATNSNQFDARVGVGLLITSPGLLTANIEDTANVPHVFSTPLSFTITTNVFQHVALTFNRTNGAVILYTNGVPAAGFTNIVLKGIVPQTSYTLWLGFDPGNAGVSSQGRATYFGGTIDEPSVYNRALSASEIKAIHDRLGAGKFDRAPAVPDITAPENLAEANVTIQGASSVIYGSNTNWQTGGATFTAIGNSTPIIVAGLEPGILLDNFTLSGAKGGNLYYQPEEPIDGSNGKEGINGRSAFGTWTLEVQDDRAGAANGTLLGWQLEFVFANTNFIATSLITNSSFVILTNRVPYTNSTPVPSNGVVFYQVNVPLNADWATNRLLSADAPLNVWWSTNFPPTVGTGNDVLGIPNLTSGSFLMGSNTVPLLIPGTTYYLGVQNLNSFTVTNYAVEVDFHLIGQAFAFTEPATLVTGTNAQLNGMATPNGYPSTVWFQWGTNTLYGNNTPPVSVGNGFNVVYTTDQISGLVTNVAYHFRLVVSNAVGTIYGFDQILDEANVICWGANDFGQLNVPTNLNNVVRIAGAYDHNLAIGTNALVTAWGDNTFGQATVPAGLSNVVAVAGGQYYSLALRSDGTVTNWGANFLGNLNTPTNLNSVVEIAGGFNSSLALQNNGNVVTWGAGGVFPGLTNMPPDATNIVAVAGGGYHSLALRNDGTVTAWGYGNATNVPAGLSNVVAIAAGGFHSLVLSTNGTVVAWGDNGVGQTNVPASATNVVAIAAGGFHSLALKADGTVVSWGDNSAGQLNVPVGLTNMVAVSAGYLHSMVLTPQFLINSTNIIVLDLTAGVPQTNNILPGNITYYRVIVPTNADFSTNTLLFASAPLNVWWSTNTPPTLGATNATLLLGGVTNGAVVLSTNTTPALVPGSIYYLGVQNTNSVTVNYAIEVDFHLVIPVVITLTNGVAQTNVTAAGSFTYYLINVPANADIATNTLLFATGPVNLWFNPAGLPVGTNPPDVLLLGGALNGVSILTTTSNPTNIVPGSAYYLGLQNTNSFAVTNALRVDFHLTTNAPIVISGIIATNIGTNFGYLLIWYAPTNDIFLVQETGNLNPPQTWNTFSNIVTYPGPPPPLTNGIGQFRFFDDGSQFPFGPARFYRLLLVNTPAGGAPQTNSIPGGGLDYFLINVPANADFATNDLLFADGPLNVLFNQTAPPTGTNAGDHTLLAGATNGISVLSTTSVPTNIVPGGTYWLAVQNTNSFAVTYGLEVDFHLQAVTPGSISSLNITYTTNSLGTNGFLLTWFAPTNDVFQVQRTDSLSPQNWLFFTNFISYTGPLTATNGLFSFFDDGSQTPPGLPLTRFYRILLAASGSSTHTNTVFISSVTSTNISSVNGFLLAWSAPTNYLFEVQWTTNLTPVITWRAFPNIIAYSTFVGPTNSLFDFFDDGAQGGLGPLKFYRLLLLP